MMHTYAKYEPALLTTFVRSFAELLQKGAGDDRLWTQLQQDIGKHGLLSARAPRPVDHSFPEVDPARLTDRRYRRWLAKQLLKPQPKDYCLVQIPLERNRLGDSSYLAQMASILGYRWMLKLAPQEAPVDAQVMLLQTNAALLALCLQRLGRHQSNAASVAHFIGNRLAQQLVDEAFGEYIEKTLDAVVQKARAEMDRNFAEIQRDSHRAFAELGERINARVDAMQAAAAAARN